MSRGGRGGGRGRGARRSGPDLSWEDEPIVADNKKPEPLFPELNPPLSSPKPLSEDETERVNDYLTFRDAVHNSPFYAVLETSSFTDEKGHLNNRAGVNPFTAMEKYSARFNKPKPTIPDLRQHTFHLPFFPREMWSTLDPSHKSPAWRKRKPSAPGPLPKPSSQAKKRKRAPTNIPSDSEAEDDDDDHNDKTNAEEEEDDEDAPVAATRRRKRPVARKTGDAADQEKSGLEAEDDIPDVEQGGGVDDDDGMGSEVSDAVFSDDEGGDYAAETYFDDGMGEDGYADDGDGGGEGTFD